MVPCGFSENLLFPVPRSRCSNSSKTIVKETPNKNSKLFEAPSIAPASSSTSILGAPEQPSHKAPLYSPPSYSSSIFESPNSTAQQHQENVPASSTQSEGKNQQQQTSNQKKKRQNHFFFFPSLSMFGFLQQLGKAVVVVGITTFLILFLFRVRLCHFAQGQGFQNPSSKVRGWRWHPEEAGGEIDSKFFGFAER